MLFLDLQRSLLESVRARIRNGELTERRLAKLTGVSQPHIHNVLKGARILSTDLADRVLSELHLSIIDLLDREKIARFLADQATGVAQACYIPVLSGRIGPGHAWPTSVESYERFPIPAASLGLMTAPIVGRVATDVRMQHVFSDGDFVLLDQSHRSRSSLDPESYYAVKRGSSGMIRRLRLHADNLFLISDDCLHKLRVGRKSNWRAKG